MRRNILGQVRIGETIAILFIFIVLLLLGFTFYARLQRVNIQTDITKTTDSRAIELVQRVSFIPELQCSSKNIVTSNCIDILKMESFTQIAQQNIRHYSDTLLFSTIVVDKVYPTQSSWTIYNNTLNDTSAIFTPVPILLYNATSKRYDTGMLKIFYYPFTPT